MAASSDPTVKVIGIALIVLGAGLVFWGYQLADSLGSQLAETISGSMSDEVMVRYIGGAISMAVGAYLVARR